MLGFDALSKRSRVARRLVLNAAAKINLALEVLGRRDDGYHEIATVMQAVDLSDRLVLEDADVLELRTTALDVPTDGTNLALKAAATLREMAGSSRGTRITLEKRIPVAAGLGGGSTGAAAALRSRQPSRVAAALGNTLERVATSRYREVEQMEAALQAAGALGTAMSGSGLTVFGVARSFDHARQIRARVARARWACWAVRTLRGPAIRVR